MDKIEIPELFKEFEDRILKTMKVSNEITYKKGKTLPWESKLGGCPYMEKIEEYPKDKDGVPYFFLAQINFEEIHGIKDFPSEGILQFYVKRDDVYGLYEEDGFVVRYVEKVNNNKENLVENVPLVEDNEQFYPPYEHEGKMLFTLRNMPVSVEDNKFNKVFEGIVFTENQEKESYEVFDGYGNRVGGYPGFTQGDPRDDKSYDTLLLQLDMDDECGIMFGDSGVANFFIASDDLKNKDFSKVYYTWDCC
ncbi:uncharacterized protein YwqG [Clostridium acetobutylicum]|uniref:Conserved protein, ortholog YwqG B.subtilis n=1 Tax=Clostridium acetobutylicum (strain ATCC 824 / DSM 792 / JCM 1419 / IAM 19013 / LMG 5710 / NBRC 13948 / NRRL B-527 / VKM B-1787 / 2291 / W) TaxID=272562 RepID=Q97KU6_CLOAB|nr:MULTISPECIES: YwqG family protein [Clostridium]AAK78796.1 Conserved protein, ortholog YwqG B.subtilis [Clostridium acetobutylicum ATCC 824]ADZ19870.1 Conserved hypothetical protein [Clostridium acetobutylicum EA 2018]AEI33463.1 hypothetical protein SMB_G0836 [Clostridium acetobutylicum DSM 1731]AWV80514.1 DUF1963 domain-containing protein [Clostridium acetobutylicum]MBC2392704.1 DUF1963 domain-containing protein [Clostridium acetobutylicum]